MHFTREYQVNNNAGSSAYVAKEVSNCCTAEFRCPRGGHTFFVTNVLVTTRLQVSITTYGTVSYHNEHIQATYNIHEQIKVGDVLPENFFKNRIRLETLAKGNPNGVCVACKTMGLSREQAGIYLYTLNRAL
jgi:hypothetical protein